MGLLNIRNTMGGFAFSLHYQWLNEFCYEWRSIKLRNIGFLETMQKYKSMIPRKDKVLGSLNVAFLCLIQKTQEGTSFIGNHPITHYNVIYKIISKSISKRIKIMVSLFISQEKSRFLQNQNILDIVPLLWEVMYLIKSTKYCAIILKLYLSKESDRMD